MNTSTRQIASKQGKIGTMPVQRFFGDPALIIGKEGIISRVIRKPSGLH